MFIKIILSLFLLVSFIGCSSNQNSDSNKSPSGPRNPGNDNNGNGTGTETNPKICVTNKVVEILLDKKTIISQSAADSYQYIVWDHETLTKKNEIDRSKNYHRLSPNGEFVLRTISDRKFQLEHLAINSTYRESLSYSGTIKSVDFSSKSDFVIGTSRSRKLLDEVTVFDILKKEKVFETTLENVKFAQMIDDQHLYIASGYRYSNTLNIFDITKEVNNSIKLRSGELRWLGISKNVALTKVDYRYYAYDLNKQEQLYNMNIRAVYDFDYETDLAIISLEDFNQIHILDMQTGLIRGSFVRPENVYISTCRFTEDASVYVCRSKENVDKVVLWNTQTDSTKEVCF